jgi:hypothetical protein
MNKREILMKNAGKIPEFQSIDVLTAVPLTFSRIVWDEWGVVFLDRMPHGCGIRAYMDVFTACHGK